MIDIPKWVTEKHVVSDVEDLTTATTTRNIRNIKWRISFNNGNGMWGFHMKYYHKEWKEKQGNNEYVHFDYSATNSVTYCSHLIFNS